MRPEFWKGKTVLVTGHNGFKGAWLSKWLDMLGAEVVGVSLRPDEKNEFGKLTFGEAYTDLELDIRDPESLHIIRRYSPQLVIHLAAQAIVRTAKEYPADTFGTNVMGTVNLLEQLRDMPSVRSVVVVTSDKVYENRERAEAYTESDGLMGSEPYSCSKVAEEQVAKAYYESYFRETGVGLATARGSNAFGGGDYHFDRLIPYLEECACRGVAPEIRNPDAVRPWQYVLDLLAGYLTLAEFLIHKPNDAWQSYNFGPEKSELYTVGQMAGMICGNAVECVSKQDFYEAGLLMIDSEKSKETLGWHPLYNVRDGLLQTGASYREYFRNGNSDRIYEDAIADYMERLERSAEIKTDAFGAAC